MNLMKRAESETDFTEELQRGYTLALNIVLEFRTRPTYKERMEKIANTQLNFSDKTNQNPDSI